MAMRELLIPPLNRAARNFDLPNIPRGREIPRLIHQTFKSKDLPPELRGNVDRIKSLNPTWQHRIYDDADIEDFILDVYGRRILGYFKRINNKYGAARADLFRYLLLYRYGGAYLDIKSTFVRPIDEVLQPGDTYLLSRWRNKVGEEHEGWGFARDLRHVEGGEFQQWHIVSAPGHPFLKAVIENVLTNIDRYHPWLHGTGSSAVFRVTGPVAYTLAILPLLDEHRHRIASDAELGFEYSIFKTSSHRPLFGTHYAKQTESVIEMQGTARLSAVLYDLAKKGKRRLVRLLEDR
jgi:hypothetical protein